jgi:hypothetical protein
MSLDRIRRLLADANTQPDDAAALRRLADQLAAEYVPEVQHADYGVGSLIGVTPDGLLEVRFGAAGWAVAVSVEAVREAEWPA